MIGFRAVFVRRRVDPMSFSLYVHIPYCDSKCPYCDFNSHAARRWPERRYVAALRRELAAAADGPHWGGPVRTIFFGGGTPSLFDPASIASVLEDVRRHWELAPSVEITLEANPGTVDEGRLRGFAAAGINRLSFGVQSFQPALLSLLGRIHDGPTAIRAVGDGHRAGFDNINVDLMFAVPGQSLEAWRADLRQAIDLGTAHVSAYNLTVEEGTAFHLMRRRGELAPLGEDAEIAMYEATEDALTAAGFLRYEISNYALPGRACEHNLSYWRALPYLGIGAGAHSFSATSMRRWSNELGPEAYMRAIEARGGAAVGEESLTARQLQGEFVFLGLRCREGIEVSEFARRFGVDFAMAFPHCRDLQNAGLLEQSGANWQLTERGRMVSDEVFATFV